LVQGIKLFKLKCKIKSFEQYTVLCVVCE